MKFTHTINFKPRMCLMKAVTLLVGFGMLSAVGVSLPVALPWAIIIALSITFTYDE